MIKSTEVILIVIGLISGAINTLSLNMQNKQPVIQADFHKHFFHPYMQTAMRFVSNTFSLVAALLLKRKYRQKSQLKLNPLKILIPIALDYIFSVCYYTALNFVPGSVYQMLRGGTLIATYLFTVIILKVTVVRQKLVGCAVVLLGMTTVGLVNFLLGEQTGEEGLMEVGYGLIVVGLIANGLHFVYEQYLIKHYGVDPLWLNGLQGCIGVLASAIIVPLLVFADCPFPDRACVYTNDGREVIQSVSVYFREVFDSGILLGGVMVVLVSMVVYTSVGAVITKRLSSLARALIDVSRTVIIWVVGVVVTATIGASNSSFNWQSLSADQIGGEAAGFALLIIGNFIYYQIIPLQCFAPKNCLQHSLVSQQQ